MDEAPKLAVWRRELVRVLDGDPTDLQVVHIEGVVRSRSILVSLDALAREASHPAAPVFQELTARCVLRMARDLRTLGLTRRDVRRLDLGRRRPALH